VVKMANQNAVAEAEELAALLGILTPRYRQLVARSDFRPALNKLARKLVRQAGDHPAAARLEDARAELG
jgi:hypothetical protein